MTAKKIISLLMAVLIILPFFPKKAFAANQLSITSDTAVLMDAKTGQILYEKQMDKVKYPASITKIVSVYLSFLGTNPDDKITVCEEDHLNDLSVTHISLLDGETVTLKDMQHAAILMSANDACNVIARHVGGSYDDFVDSMNKFASDLGCTSTNFTNPHGLPDPNHYTTAHDMAVMTREAIKLKEFLELLGTLSYEMPATNKQPERPFSTRDSMLKHYEPYYYKYAIGGKLGWTEEAHHTKVTVAEKDGRTLIAVVMDSHSPESKYTDTIKLLDYGFNEFGGYSILPQTVQSKEITVKDGANPVGKLELFLSSPAKVYLHKSIDVKDISYKFPDVDSVEQSEIDNKKFYLEVNLPDYAADVMYSTAMTLKLDTNFVPNLSTVKIPPKKDQLIWLGKEIGKIVGISFGITMSSVLFILLIILIRKYIIIYRRKKHKRKLAIKRKKQLEAMRVIERQKSPYKMTSTYNTPVNNRVPQNNMAPKNRQYNTKPKVNASAQTNKKRPRH